MCPLVNGPNWGWIVGTRKAQRKFKTVSIIRLEKGRAKNHQCDKASKD